MRVIMILLVLVVAYLLVRLRLLRKPSRALPPAKVTDHDVPIVRRSYVNGQERPEAATQPDSGDSDVTFADGVDAADENTAQLPAWEGLESGPVCVLGPENEYGTPNEYLVTPPEKVYKKNTEENTTGVVDDYPDEGEPSVADMTEEEQRAIAEFDVRAFR